MAAIVFGLAGRLRSPSLTERHDSTVVLGLFVWGGLKRELVPGR